MSAFLPAEWLASAPELLTVEETAKLLRVTRTALYARVERKQIPHHRIGRSLLFRRDDLRRLLAETYVPAKSEGAT